MLKSEEIQKQIDIMTLELDKLKKAHADAIREEDEKNWFKEPRKEKIMCCSDPSEYDYMIVEDANAQMNLGNMNDAIVFVRVMEDDEHGDECTMHLNLEGMIKLRDFLSRRIDYHGRV